MNVMIAVTVSVRMKVTADAITPTATVDNPELSELSISDNPLSASYSKVHVIYFEWIHT